MKRSYDCAHSSCADPKLPPHWHMERDRFSGDMYYWNEQTDQVQWSFPYRRHMRGRVHCLKQTYGFIRPIPCLRERMIYFRRKEAPIDMKVGEIVGYDESNRATNICVLSASEATQAISNEVRFTGIIHTVKNKFAFAFDSSCNKDVFVWTHEIPFALKSDDQIDFLCIDTDKGLQAIDVDLHKHGVIFKSPPNWLKHNNIERLCIDWIGVSILNLTYANAEAHITFRTAKDAESAYTAWESYGAQYM